MKLNTILFALGMLLLSSCGNDSAEEEGNKYVHVPPALPAEVFDRLQEGDCIMRKGNGPLSYHLMNSTKEEYSHCGIIVREDDQWQVIHTLGGSVNEDETDGMQMCSVEEFVKYAADSMLYICRPIFKDSVGHAIADRARFYLDKHVPFDHAFSMYSEDEFFCSELLFYIFKDVNGSNVFEIKKKHKSYMLMFSTFFDESKFEPVFHLKSNKEDWYGEFSYSFEDQ